MFLTPKEKDRQVVAVYFGQMGGVERVAQYGLKDGKVFDEFRRRVRQSKLDLHALIAPMKKAGHRIYGIGAPSRW